MKLLVIYCLVALIYAKFSASDHRVPRAFVGGEDAVPHEFPWVVKLYMMEGGQYSGVYCTGSLISPNIVLTAAHCVMDTKQSDSPKFWATEVQVYAGYHKSPPMEHSSTKHVVRYSKKYVVPPLPKRHDNYEFYDLAIIILSKPIKPSKTIGFIELANQKLSMVHSDSCYAAGFGYLSNDVPTKVLQKLRFKLMNRADCQRVIEIGMRHRPAGKPAWMKVNDMICAHGIRKGSYIYGGDSGGPFMCPNDQGKWMLYGITEGRFQSPEVGLPRWVSLFTNIESAKEWLVKAIRFYSKH